VTIPAYQIGDRVWVRFRGQWGRVISHFTLAERSPVYVVRLDCGVPCTATARGLSRHSPYTRRMPMLRLVVDNVTSLPPCDVEA